MATKKTQLTSAGVATPAEGDALPTVDEFSAAVKYVLTHEHAMPILLAEQLMANEAEFIERHRKSFLTTDNAVFAAADGLIFEPPKGVEWVALTTGSRVADSSQVVLDADGALGRYLDALVSLGLHGKDRDSVANVMLAKGIETVFALIPQVPKPR